MCTRNAVITSLLRAEIHRPSLLELEYFAVEEGTGNVLGKTVLKRVGEEIHEIRAGKTGRRFRMKNGVAVEINWNGPVSHLKDSLKEAVSGSPISVEP